MHSIDLSKYDIRTDLIIERVNGEVKNNHYEENNVRVDDISLDEMNNLGKKPGKYITISFDDMTDHNNYQHVLGIFIKELRKMISWLNIKDSDTCLIIGLGNKEIIADALGNKTLKSVIVTRHLYLIGDYDKKYRNVSILEPSVVGITGIESNDLIEGIIKKNKPNFVIIVDSLCASSINRLNKTIQITNTGIAPGSGIGNNKRELSLETLKVPVIAIGVPTVVDSTVIVSDTIDYLKKKMGYLKNNLNNNIDKLKPVNKVNYLNSEKELNDMEKKELLGDIGLLSDLEIKKLVWEVLSPINSNMIVTTKEIDFVMEKLGSLIGTGINRTLHNI